MKTTPALAYSYLRFSSSQQAQGDSIRRQKELRDGWLARTGAVLDTSVRMTDEGKSAFTGEHRKNPDRHALAAFLQLVEKGRIPRGSYYYSAGSHNPLRHPSPGYNSDQNRPGRRM